jgi:hypothetical protein
MKRFILAAIAIISIGVGAGFAANYAVTQGSGTNFGSVVVGGVNYAQQFICDLTTPAQCAAVSAGGAVSVAGPVTNAGTFATQLTGATNNINNVSGTVSLPTGASTAAKQPALGTAGSASADVLTVQGIASMTPFLTNPGTAANWGVVTTTQNSSSATLGHMVLGQFNTSPTTITSGNMSPLQMDASGNLLVNIKAGAGSGGTALADQAAFTQGTTSITPIGCLDITSYTGLTSGHAGVVSCTSAGSVHTTVDSIASGVIASGAIASGAVASGAISSGAIASGAAVDGWDVTEGAKADVAWVSGSGSLIAISKTIANNTGSAVPAGTNVIGYTSNDPCSQANKTNLPISQNGTSSVQLVALSGSTTIYVCSLVLVAAGATTVALTTGTGSACVTGNAAVLGTTTASIANSISLLANGGLTLGNGGGTIAKGAASGELCMINGSNVFVSGNLTYVQQ